MTSVYFDNDALRLYHDKIVRKEGATLIRVRWYGKEGSTCFVERKVHTLSNFLVLCHIYFNLHYTLKSTLLSRSLCIE